MINSRIRSDFIKGVDLSGLLKIEENGGIFKENEISIDALQIFSEHTLNYVRLRIWHTPVHGYNSLSRTLQMASRIKSSGLKFLLDFHYSDTWADPGHQTKPIAWENISFQALKDSVYQYTNQVITELKNQNTLPDIIQIGNEIICGMLWNDGLVCDQYNTPEQWSQFAELITQGINGVNDGLDADDTVKIMIHIDHGGNNIINQWFFDHLLAENVNFDIIGLSYYPWWHGTMNDFEFNVQDLAQRYGKNIILAETAYPWTLEWNDNTQNIVGDSSQLHPGYPATVEGQRNFISDLIEIILNIPNNNGLGLFYWAPEWISTSQSGSPWENMALFDFTGEVLSSITVFDSTLSGLRVTDEFPIPFSLNGNYPNPFNPLTTIHYDLPKNSFVRIVIYDIMGRKVSMLASEKQNAGYQSITWNGTNDYGAPVSAGVYLYQIRAGNFAETRTMVLLK